MASVVASLQTKISTISEVERKQIDIDAIETKLVKHSTSTSSDQFSEQEPDLSDCHEAEIEKEYSELMSNLTITDGKLEMSSILEIKRHIASLKPKKSAGCDSVSNFMIKNLPPDYMQCLVNCFNEWIRDYRCPIAWKLAKIVTLNKLKAGIPICDQTRPISLLATYSKLF